MLASGHPVPAPPGLHLFLNHTGQGVLAGRGLAPVLGSRNRGKECWWWPAPLILAERPEERAPLQGGVGAPGTPLRTGSRCSWQSRWVGT